MFEWLRLFAAGVLAFGVANVVMGGAGRSVACRVAYAVIGGAVLAVLGVLWALVGGLAALGWSIGAGLAAAATVNGLRVQNAFGRAWVLPAWGGFDWLAGAVVVAVFVFGVGSGDKKLNRGPGQVAPVGQRSAGASVGVAGACACYSGAELCTGPQGGKYCVSDDGKKRYR